MEHRQYLTAIRKANARKDMSVDRPGGIGEVERWIAPDGRIVAWLIVRYFKGGRVGLLREY